jgi:dihydrofolate reductase
MEENMARRLVMTLAMSLDGYIADADGGYGWIKGDGSRALDTPNRWDYEAFLRGIDLVVMGRECYDQGMAGDFPGKTVLVSTHRPLPDSGNVRFIGGDVCAALRQELLKPGKDVFLFGGGKLADSFIREDMVDEYILGIVPVILGAGRKLFYGGNAPLRLRLTECMLDEGIAILRYARRPAAGTLENKEE